MRQNFPTLICKYCEQPFQARNWKPTYQPQFCSRQCHGKSKRALLLTVECVECQRSFPRKEWHANKTQGRGPFCGFSCYAAWQSRNLRGPNNSFWKGEPGPELGSAEWTRNRRECLTRDGYRCRACNSTDRLTVHHKIPWAEGQEDPHALGNLVTLCAPCHHRLHYLMRRVPALQKLEQELAQLSQSIR